MGGSYQEFVELQSMTTKAFFKSYEKFNHTSSVDCLRGVCKKFGEISVIINRTPQYTSNCTKRYLKKNKYVKLAFYLDSRYAVYLSQDHFLYTNYRVF